MAIAHPSSGSEGMVWCIDHVFRRPAPMARSCFGSGVDGPHMLSAGRRIGVQTDAEGRRGAVARRTMAGIDQAADKPGFPAFERAVFNPPEEAVGCKVAIEATAHFGGIAAETGEEIEAFLQLGVGSDRAGKFAHFVEGLLVLEDQHSVLSFHSGMAAAEAARGAAGVHSRSLWSHCQGSDRASRRPAFGRLRLPALSRRAALTT